MNLRSWWTRRDLDEGDFQEEIRAHLEIAIAERVEAGEDPVSARYAALREFGNVTKATEVTRGVWTPRWLEGCRNLLNDVRYAVRTLGRNPVFSVAVIGVLTLGIGLNAAVFTMLKSIVLSPVAGVDGSARLAVVYGETSSGRQLRLSYPDYQNLRDHNAAFSELFGTIVATVGLGRGKHARSVWGEIVTGNYFQVLGVRAQLGRTLLPSDEVAPGRHPVVVISDVLWRRDFAADPGIVGRTIEINNVPLTVVGVTAASFHGTTVVYDVEVYVPVMMAPQLGFTFGTDQTSPSAVLSDRRATVFYPQGYLRPGVSLSNAAAQTGALWTPLARERSAADAVETLRVVKFWQTPNGAPTFMLPTLTVLVVMGLLVLLIACANIAGLVLVRGISRRGEIALRLALGAARGRIIRLLVVENLVLAIPGALFGVLLARTGIPVFVRYAEGLAAPQRVFFNIEVDAFVIGFAAISAVVCALVFGFVPALQSSRIDLVTVINEDASPRGASRGRLRSGLVVAQVAVSLLLLVGAGLVTRTLEAARRANAGFDPIDVTNIVLDVKQNAYDEARGRMFYRKLLDDARAEAGVEAATLAVYTPLNMTDTRARRVAIEGHEPRRGEDLAFMFNVIASDYFRTLRIPLRAGRAFEDRDNEAAEPVVVVNSTLAHRFWGGDANAIGRRLRVADGQWRTVIGVAADLKYVRVNEAPRPYLYLPFLQAYRPDMVLQTRGGTGRIIERLRARVEALDPNLPIQSARPMADRIAGALIFYNLTATMLFIFGTAGMALAALGTYGLVSYTVRQSMHEIGIRVALGASRGSVIRGFVARGLRLAACGVVLGVVASLGVTRLLGHVLFGVSSTDAASYASALTLVLGGVIVATIVPAWRAARTSPLHALRHQ